MVKLLLTTIIMLLSGILVCLVINLVTPKQQHEAPHVDVKQVATPRQLWNISYSNKNLFCLSEAIFHEAGIETKAGKEAVGIVILNRASAKSTEDICSIIHESMVVDGKRVCQFSYYCLPPSKRINPIAGLNWADSMLVSIELLNNRVDKDVYQKMGEAMYFHADYVHPSWSKDKRFLAKIGSHLFYAEE